MRDRRAYERTDINIKLQIEELYRQDDVKIDKVNETIIVTDISKLGIGFKSKHELPLGYYFNARISLEEDKRFYCVIKIIRRVIEEEIFHYGCEFVGLAEMLSEMIVEYQDGKKEDGEEN